MFNGRQSPTMQSELDVRLGKVVIKMNLKSAIFHNLSASWIAENGR